MTALPGNLNCIIIGVVGFQVFAVVDGFVEHDPHNAAVVAVYRPLTPQNGGCHKLVKFSVLSHQKFYILPACQEGADDFFQSLFCGKGNLFVKWRI